MRVGNYESLTVLGEGAYGRVFEARHRELKTPAVIKQRLELDLQHEDDLSKTLFRDEALILSRLHHYFLPTCLDYIERPEQAIVMPRMPGVSLHELVRIEPDPDTDLMSASHPLTDEHICWVVDRILDSLSYLHGHCRITHCDLKPANIIIDVSNHHASLIDFGMAFCIDSKSWSKAKGGTLGYEPPEFTSGFAPEFASDIYTVGKVVCSISGGCPEKGEFAKDMNPKLRAFFETWIKCDPRRRPNNADELRYELKKLRHTIFGRTTTPEIIKHRF